MINMYQGGILADRYLETILADWKQTSLLLLQAPLLAGMAVLVWGNEGQANPSLYFVMTLSMIWIGCMDACREIVKELPLFLRERMFNLEVGAYLYSKLRVLVLLNFVQAVCYGVIIYKFIDVRVAVGWVVINMFFSSICGTCLGLLVSSLVKRSDYAVGAVPLLILPQIIFSEFTISKDKFAGASEVIYKLMPSRWGYESLMEFAKTNGSQLTAGAYLLPLLLFGAVFLAISYPVLRLRRY